MKLKKILLAVICLVVVTPLASCWNYREIDKLSIVSGIAIDRDENGNYLLSLEIVNMSSGGKETQVQSNILHSHGETLFDAIRNAIAITAPKLYWSHSEIVIISEKVAREGVIQIIDFLYRDAEPRMDMALLVSQMETAGEILQSDSFTMPIRSFEISQMLDAEKSLSKTPLIQVYEFYNAMAGEGISAVMAAVDLHPTFEGATSHLNGTAVFSRDRLVGYLNQEDTRSYLFVVDGVKGGLLPCHGLEAQERSELSFEIFESRTSMKPVYENEALSFDLNVRTEVNIGECGIPIDYMDQEQVRELEEGLSQSLRSDIEQVIKKVQKQWGTDIFGFGQTLYRENPEVWREAAYNWAGVFKELQVNVRVKIVIRNSAQLMKPLEVGD